MTAEHRLARAVQTLQAEVHGSPASSPLNWRPRRFKWTRPFGWKTKSGFCACAITFQSQSTTSYNIQQFTFCPHSVFMCFAWISEQRTIISLYSINWLVFITQTECVYCEVRTGSLNIIQVNLFFKELEFLGAALGFWCSYFWRHCLGCSDIPKIMSRLKILGVRRVSWRKFRTDSPQILGATI
jgi:hypothetical protein